MNSFLARQLGLKRPTPENSEKGKNTGGVRMSVLFRREREKKAHLGQQFCVNLFPVEFKPGGVGEKGRFL